MTIYVTPSGKATPNIYKAASLARFEAQPTLSVIHRPAWKPPEGESGAPACLEVG